VARAFGSGILFVSCLLAATPGHAQTPGAAPAAAMQAQPVTGFVSAYEITRIARSAGFDPLAPPLREGTIYVLRATDYRGILMRVVIDARTGAIRDANRIVPGPGRYGQFYGGPSVYGPDDFIPPALVPETAGIEPDLVRPDLVRPTTLSPSPLPLSPHGLAHSAMPEIPPLPRPRPAALASRKPLDGGTNGAMKMPPTEQTGAVPPAAAAEAKPEAKPETKPQQANSAAAAPSSTPTTKKSPAIVEPLND
jgi:hypothetical protein